MMIDTVANEESMAISTVVAVAAGEDACLNMLNAGVPCAHLSVLLVVVPCMITVTQISYSL